MKDDTIVAELMRLRKEHKAWVDTLPEAIAHQDWDTVSIISNELRSIKRSMDALEKLRGP